MITPSSCTRHDSGDNVMSYAMNFSLDVELLPITHVRGKLDQVVREELLFLQNLVDLPDGEFVTVVTDPQFRGSHRDDLLGIVNVDGMVSCISVTHQNSWRTYGTYYGYPTCCINYFVAHGHFACPSHDKLVGTGYLPCPACSETSAYDMTEIINHNRHAPEPFPMESKGMVPGILKYLICLKGEELANS